MTAAFDSKRLLERVGGDRELLAEIAELFIHDAPRQVDNLRSALLQRSAESLSDAAHAIKSASGTMGIKRVYHAAGQLECGALDNQRDLIATWYTSLTRDLSEALDGIERYTAQVAASSAPRRR